MQPSPHQVLSGTLLSVVSPGDGNSPWRGLVQPFEQARAVCLVLAASPGDIQPGDDIHLHAVRHPDASSDARFPDEVHAADVWSASSRQSTAIVVDPSLSQQPLQDAQALAEHLGLSTLASLAQQGALLLRQAGDCLVVGRSRESLDPAIAWVMRRFDDPATNQLRGIGTLFLDPAVFMAAPAPRTPVRWVNDLLDPLLRRQRNPSFKSEQVERLSRLTAMLPIVLPSNARAVLSQMVSDSGPAFQATTTADAPSSNRMGIVAPYPVQNTGLLFWQTVTMTQFLPLMPKHFISADARNKLVAAHETGHAYNAAFGHRLDDALRNETFADAVSILSYVSDTGDVAAAEQWADMRTMGVLFGVQSHATGPACHAAIQRGDELRHQYGDTPIPLKVILEEAEHISLRTTHPVPEDLQLMQTLLLHHDPDYKERSIADIAVAVDAVLARDQYTFAKPTETARMFRAAVAAMERSTFTTPELADPAVLAEALRVERVDLDDTTQHLRRIGLGPLVPETLSRVRLSLGLAGMTSDKRQPEASPTAPDVLVAVGATAGVAHQAPSLLRLVRQAAEKALHGVVTWVQGSSQHNSAQSLLVESRDAQIKQAEAYHAKAFHIKRAPSGGLVMLAGGGEAPACPSFTLALPERLQRASALGKAALGLLADGSTLGAQGAVPLSVGAEAVRAALQEVAWTIRVDHASWLQLTDAVAEETLVALERAAASTTTEAGFMHDPGSLRFLAELAEDCAAVADPGSATPTRTI